MADIENFKRRHAFKPGDDPAEDYHAIVVLSEGKKRVWVFRGEMRKHHIIMRIALISRKNREHNQATEKEIKYWHETVANASPTKKRAVRAVAAH